MPFSLISPIASLVMIAAVLGGGYWLVDKIGDRREAKVHARYAKAAQAVNLRIEDFSSEDERVAAVSEAIRQKALASALQLARNTPEPNTCAASKDQAATLSQIR